MKFITTFTLAFLMAIASASASSDDNNVVIYQFEGPVSELNTNYPDSRLGGLDLGTLSLPGNHIIKFTYTRTSKKLLSQLRQNYSLPQSGGPDFPEEGDSVTHNWTRTEGNGVFEYTQTLTFMDGAWVETFSQREYVGPPPEADSV